MSFKSFFLSLTIVAILLFSAFGTTVIAYADDGTTTPPTEPGTPVPSADGTVTPVVTETAPSVDGTVPPVATDVAPSTDGTVPVVTETVPEVAPEPILEQLPDNTTVAVVNADGEAQPLVSQASADAILLSDPIWCPAGQAPTPGANGCTVSYSSFTLLLTFLKANEGDVAYQQAGTIYVQQGAYLGGETSIDLNSYNFTNLNQQALTIQGGWDTSWDPNVVPDPTYTTTEFKAPIIIGSSANPWAGSLTFNNISVSGVKNQTGLTAYSTSDITVSNVQVTNSLNGANLNSGNDVKVSDSKFDQNKQTGATINAARNVEISNSTFNNNGSSKNAGKGLEIVGKGAWVTLANVHADNNQLSGANIQASGDVTLNNSFFDGSIAYTSTCNGEIYSGYGLQVVTTSGIYLNQVSASGNSLFGAHLDGSQVNIYGGHFNNNGSDSDVLTGKGVEILSKSLVSITDIEANGNQLFGADIQAVGSVSISKGYFNGNTVYSYSCKGTQTIDGGGYGLQIVTAGDITLADIEASNNYLYGAHLTGAGVAIATSAKLLNLFSNNGSGSIDEPTGDGLQINSTKSVSLINIEANNNQLFGANIQLDPNSQSLKNVAISNSFFNGNKGITYTCKDDVFVGYGLQIVTSGNVSLNTVDANNNNVFGAHVEGGDVYVSYGNFMNNSTGNISDHVGKGLEVISTGSDKQVNLYQVNASNNQLLGADVKADGYVSVNTSIFTNNKSYDDDAQVFYGYGLSVLTKSNINLYMVEANFNNLWGGNLTGLDVWVEKSQFNNNVSDSVIFIDDTGLLVNSAGNVTLETVEAKENRLIGADVRAVGNIFINNSIFTDNRGMTCDDTECSSDGVVYHGYGLNAIAGGTVELKGVTADRNNLWGAHLEGSAVSVSNSTFNNNGSGDTHNLTGRGLEIVSTGTVTLDNVTASNNQLFGATIQTPGLVNVSNSTFENNVASHGLAITADVVVVENVTATNNGVDGAIICANDVTVNNSFFENNGRYGLNVGSPIFAESLNTYSGNGTGSLFYNPTCNPNGNDGNGNDGHPHDGDDDEVNDGGHHGHHDGGDTSDHRCSDDKSGDKHVEDKNDSKSDDKHVEDKHDNKSDDKHVEDKHANKSDDKHVDNKSDNKHGDKSGRHEGKTSDRRCSSSKSDGKQGNDKYSDNKSGHHDGKTSDSRCSSNKPKSQQSHGKKK